MARRRDSQTLELFEWTPPEDLVVRYDEQRVRAASLRARIARAVAATLRDQQTDRAEIAAQMSAWLGEEVTKNMLDAYASESRESHSISFLRVLALLHVTNDMRLLQLGAELFGHAVVEERWLSWVEVGQLSDTKDNIDRAFEAARRKARKRT